MKKLSRVIISGTVILVSVLLVLNFTVLKEKNIKKEAQVIPIGSKVSSDNNNEHSCCSEDEGARFLIIQFTS